MLFNSYVFIFLFLPLTLLGFHLIGSRGHYRMAISWLVGVSLFFYGWWNPKYLGLILISILWNYALGIYLSGKSNKVVLYAGVLGNLGLLGYFKYTNFFIDNINTLTGSNVVLQKIILPLAISFFTFQQIAYLFDACRGETKEYDFLHYCLFVTFFPQLIAGPIVHHKEMLPQFVKNTLCKLKATHIAVGLSLFMAGLFKKVIIADGVAPRAVSVFGNAELGLALTFFEAWGGALAYTFQLYFDFSGYSDMALGLARMFGIILPANFFSPYKANNIIDFWRCWHMTLSRFFRDYLYFPLGGNRKGTARSFLNLMITMLLGGLWHGAGWTFIIWGGLHGFYLIVNHAWHGIKRKIMGNANTPTSLTGLIMGRLITFIAIVFAWVVFRAESLDGAKRVYEGMLAMNGFLLPASYLTYLNHFMGLGDFLAGAGWIFRDAGNFQGIMEVGWLFLLLFITFFVPNTLEWMRKYNPALGLEDHNTRPLRMEWMEWSPKARWAAITVIGAALSILSLTKVSEFLYFQF